jgi:AP-2 complex subunit beta-1
MYWRLLSNNPAAARDIVLAEKPVISTETDRMDKGMLDQVGYPLDEIPAVKLLLHTGTLGSIYHKNPNVCCVTLAFLAPPAVSR